MEIMDFETKALKLKADIKKELNAWYDTYNVDSWLRQTIQAKCILSGSAISSVFHKELVKDWDLYFRSRTIIDNVKMIFKEDQKCIAMIDNWNAYEDNKDIPVLDGKAYTERAITLKNKIQFIIMGTLNEMRPTFDLIHCMPYYDFINDTLHISEKQLYAIENKLLIANPLRNSVVTPERIEKFEKRGWRLEVKPKTDLTKVLDLV